MKKLSTFLSMATMSAMAMAQSVTTHSVYDVNQNGEINVADAVSVAQATLQSVEPGQTQQYVTAEDLSKMLQSIQNDLTLIKEKLGIANSEGDSDGDSDTEPTPDNKVMLENGHEYVDLGLTDLSGNPIYWATCNIGADKPEDCGLYFAWGETVGYTSAIDENSYDPKKNSYKTTDGRSFDWESYSKEFCDGDWDSLKKYYKNEHGDFDNIMLEGTDDAAYVIWKSNWRIPSRDDFCALAAYCTWTWDSNRKGYTVEGPNGNSIFLPAGGARIEGNLENPGSVGCYWTSWLNTKYFEMADGLYFTSEGIELSLNDLWWGRCYGLNIRPVRY